MQITGESSGDVLQLRVTGRLDNESAGHLTTAIDEAVRLGSHAMILDLSDVNYVSSAGIGALLKAHKQFQSIRGFFGVGAASAEVSEVIRLTGLTKMLMCNRDRLRGSTGLSMATMQPLFRVSAVAGIAYELYEVSAGASLTCEVHGNPNPLPREAYRTGQCHSVEFPLTSLGLGLGAFARDFDDGADRFGEFVAVGGAVAQQPTSGGSKPDYQRVTGDFVPRVQMLYGLRCLGDFPQLIRFERVDDDDRLPLSSLVDQGLTLADADLAAFVFIAETSGLVGASLRRSPASAEGGSVNRFAHPEVRRWLSFSPDKSHVHSLAVVVGIASRGEPTGAAERLAPLLRPLAPRSDLRGHFHAAVFSYRPFKKRRLDLRETLATLFESEDLKAVLHLLHDDREITGGGESEFVRGACWVGPISEVRLSETPHADSSLPTRR